MKCASQHTPHSERLRQLAALAFALLTVSSCAAKSGRDLDAERARAAWLENALALTPPGDPSNFVVQLAFDGRADLDLYVTDTLQETVYFARRETLSGGSLAKDLRCDDAAPRIERAEFPSPSPGRYRIGVDYSAACSGNAQAVAFAVEVQYRGERVTRRGVLEPLRFEPVFWELEIGEAR